MTSSTEGPKKRTRGTQKGDPSPHQAATDKFHNFKDCRTCGENKRLADFALQGNWRKKRAADPKRYRKDCKECTRAPSAVETDPDFGPVRKPRKRARKRTAADIRADAASYKRKARRATRIKALEYIAEKGCCECGTHDPRVLEFDHINPAEKEFEMSKLFADGYSWASERLRAEIRKCRVICANCHRKHTIIQQEYYAHGDVAEALQGIYDRYKIKQ